MFPLPRKAAWLPSPVFLVSLHPYSLLVSSWYGVLQDILIITGNNSALRAPPLPPGTILQKANLQLPPVLFFLWRPVPTRPTPLVCICHEDCLARISGMHRYIAWENLAQPVCLPASQTGLKMSFGLANRSDRVKLHGLHPS